jgi:hypothetical protein
LAIAALTLLVPVHAQEQPVTPPPMSSNVQKQLAAMAADVRVYEEYRYWAYLAKQGMSAAERARRLETIREAGRRLEIDRWNRILTAEKPTFNTQPNAFLVDVRKDLPKGRALDVGMGQGRNALDLAEQGWQVTGFDPAEQAIAAAQTEAKRRNLTITTQIAGSENFEWARRQERRARSLSTLQAPAPANAKYRNKKQYNTAGTPLLTVGKIDCGAWAWKYATAISPERTNATGRVNRPSTIASPPNTSSMPARPSCDVSSIGGIGIGLGG